MRKITQPFRRGEADRKGTNAQVNFVADRGLANTDLDKVAAAGGKTGASTNPVGD